ncbi:MAG TPA: GNAT family N-acetyltransferase [Actinocatenispora sp.]
MIRHEGDDLRDMQHLAERLWSPGARWHVGDVAWGRAAYRGRPRPTARWERHGRTVAWAWLESGELCWLADPAADAVDAVLDWAPGARETTVMSADASTADVLRRRGWRRDDGPYFDHLVRDLAGLPPLGPGAAVRPVDPQSDADVLARAAAHRAAFDHLVGRDPALPRPPDPARHRAVTGTWPYRAELDLVAEVDGVVAAYCLLWLDAVNGVGLLEPVGTDPRYRRRGLARRVCLAGLYALRDAGATRAVVCPRGDDDYPVPGRLYRDLGFTYVDRTCTFVAP